MDPARRLRGDVDIIDVIGPSEKVQVRVNNVDVVDDTFVHRTLARWRSPDERSGTDRRRRGQGRRAGPFG